MGISGQALDESQNLISFPNAELDALLPTAAPAPPPANLAFHTRPQPPCPRVFGFPKVTIPSCDKPGVPLLEGQKGEQTGARPWNVWTTVSLMGVRGTWGSVSAANLPAIPRSILALLLLPGSGFSAGASRSFSDPCLSEEGLVGAWLFATGLGLLQGQTGHKRCFGR